MTEFGYDFGLAIPETRGRKGGKKQRLLWKGVAAKRAGLATYLEAVDVIYPEYIRDLPRVSEEQEARRKTDIANKIARLDRSSENIPE